MKIKKGDVLECKERMTTLTQGTQYVAESDSYEINGTHLVDVKTDAGDIAPYYVTRFIIVEAAEAVQKPKFKLERAGGITRVEIEGNMSRDQVQIILQTIYN
jgi:hypothetical protein